MPGRYAAALFDLANEASELDSVERELAAFQDMLDESEDLRRLVRSPVFSAEEQGRAMAAVLKRAGIGGLTAKFIGLVTKNRRLFAIRDMISAYRALLAEHRGEITAQVTTAEKLKPEQVETLKAALKASMGQDVTVDTTVDASLIGGLIVKVGSRMIDNSVRTKLQRLKIAMKEVG